MTPASPVRARVRFGCCGSMISPAADPVGIEIVEAIAALQYDYIELSLRDLVALSEPALAAVAARLRATGLPCEACNNFFPPEIRLTGPAAERSTALEYAKRALAIAARLGVRVVVFGSSGARNVPAGFPLDAAWAQLRALLVALGPVAERHGIEIAIEPLNRGESNILNTVADGWRMTGEVAQPHVRLLADAFHMRLENEDPAILVDAGPVLAHVHVAQAAERLFPAGNDPALRDFFRHLRASGYAGRCSIEANTSDLRADAGRALRVCRELAAEGDVA